MIRVIGNPFTNQGMGEHSRSVLRSLLEFYDSKEIRLFNVSGSIQNHYYKNEFEIFIDNDLNKKMVNIFCLNGDEANELLKKKQFINLIKNQKTIIYPAWELNVYPTQFVKVLNKFDQLWAPSKFCYNVYKVIHPNVIHLTLASEPKIENYFSHLYFDIDPSAYNFFFSFDTMSYHSRKNPYAVISFFKKIVAENLFNKKFNLLIKINNHEKDNNIIKNLKKEIDVNFLNIKFITENYTENEYFNLLNLVDCVISLHRSEGFGRLISEAMSLGKLAICTNYSGNLDFSNFMNSISVKYDLIDVNPNEYPYYKNCKWANPDVEDAVYKFKKIFNNQKLLNFVKNKAKSKIQAHHNYNCIGYSYFKAINKILAE
jgi:hypothetical protein